MVTSEDSEGQSASPPEGLPVIRTAAAWPNSIILPSERKVVTILFADAVESTQLIEALDPEEASDRLGPLIQAMVDGIHQFGGTVIRSEGDAIVALFGAPHAYEDHADRACHAAIAMLRRVSELADAALNIRVALHSGDVMVRSMVRDVSVSYEVTGMPMHVTSRVEKLTKAGAIYATSATVQLIRGLVGVRSVGRHVIRGLSDTMELFEVSLPLSTASLDARLDRGLTPFVGRRLEKNVLWNAAEASRAGRGQMIELVGDAGVGKSRLIRELAAAPNMADYRVLAGASASYAQSHPYSTFRSLFRRELGIESQDSEQVAVDRLISKLSTDASLVDLIPPFQAMLGLPVSDPAWGELDPLERRRLINTAASEFIFNLARNGPVLCILEDLHWMDDESRATLESIGRGIDSRRILVCVTSRTGSPSFSPNTGQYTRLPIPPLDHSESFGILDHLLEGFPNLMQIRSLIVGKAQGNPLFLEELTRMLVTSLEARSGKGEERPYGQFDFQIPNTIQSVIAARIDRLSGLEKQILQIAAVVGGDASPYLFEQVSGLNGAMVARTLASLSAAKYLINSSPAGESEYTFYHALTQEVAYRSLLKEHRRSLHAAIFRVFADLHRAKKESVAELLAHHAEQGEIWVEAVAHLRQAAANAIERSSYKEAIKFLERALEALARLPATSSRAETSIELRLRLRIALGATGEYSRLYEHLSMAEQEAILIKDRTRLGAVCIAKVHVLNMIGNIEEAVANGLRACDLAASNHDPAQGLMANYFLAQAHEFSGDYQAAISILTRDLPGLTGEHRRTRFGMTGTNSVLHLSLLSHSYAYLGAMSEADAMAREACAIANETGRPYDAGIAHFGDGIVKLCHGRIDDAIESLQIGWQTCQDKNIAALLPMIGCRLGFAYALKGDTERAAELLNQSRNGSLGATHVHCWALTFSGWCEHRRGATSLALSQQHEALRLARKHGYRGIEMWALWFLGMTLSGVDRFAEANDVLAEAAALAKSLEMRLHAGYCQRALADVQQRLDASLSGGKIGLAAQVVGEERGLGRFIS
jgi:predicted ATPase/class 3 adenylate cyclase